MKPSESVASIRTQLRHINEQVVLHKEGTSTWRVLMNLRADLEDELLRLHKAADLIKRGRQNVVHERSRGL